MSQADIDAQNAFIAEVGNAFSLGNAALNSLLETLGGNPAGATTSGSQGVPTTGTLDTDLPGIPVAPDNGPPINTLPSISDPAYWRWAPSPPIVVGGGGSGKRQAHFGRGRKFTNQPQPQSSDGNCPTIVPLVTAIPIPPAPPTAPAPVVVSAPPAAPAPVQTAPVQAAPIQAAPPAPAPLPDCRTGNWCLDIRNGCVLSSQVSPAQLQACSQAGYAGALDMYPQIAAHGGVNNGEYFGTPDPNPPPFSPGMSGLGQTAQSINSDIFSSTLEYVIAGLVSAVALGLIWKGRKA